MHHVRQRRKPHRISGTVTTPAERTGTRPQKQREHRICPHVLPQLDLAQQTPHCRTLQSFRGKRLTAKVFDFFGWVR